MLQSDQFAWHLETAAAFSHEIARAILARILRSLKSRYQRGIPDDVEDRMRFPMERTGYFSYWTVNVISTGWLREPAFAVTVKVVVVTVSKLLWVLPLPPPQAGMHRVTSTKAPMTVNRGMPRNLRVRFPTETNNPKRPGRSKA